MILLRECTRSSDAKNYYQCLNDRVEQRMRNDLRCNIPFNVLNKVNEDIPICTTTEDFEEGMTFCPNCTIYKVKNFSITVMYNLEHEVFLEELVSNPNCKPDCESWSYQVTKASHFTKKGDLLSYHTFSCIFWILMRFYSHQCYFPWLQWRLQGGLVLAKWPQSEGGRGVCCLQLQRDSGDRWRLPGPLHRVFISWLPFCWSQKDSKHVKLIYHPPSSCMCRMTIQFD